MGRHLTPEEIAVFKHEFDQYDTDKGGSISIEEFGRVMAGSSGQKPTDEELAQIIKEVDLDGDGTISFNEFITMMTGQPYPPPSTAPAAPAAPTHAPATTTTAAPIPDSLQAGHAAPPTSTPNPPAAAAAPEPQSSKDEFSSAWAAFDPSCSSSITTAQFRQVINSLGETVSDAEIEGIMDDVDGEEKISYQEFVQFMKRKEGAVDDIVADYGS